jgi:hypothetical protein
MQGMTETIQGYPGQIYVEVAPSTSQAMVSSAILALGGSVIAQLPGLGMYWAQVPAGTEAAFISSIETNPAITDASPNQALLLSQATPVVTDLTAQPEVNSPQPLVFAEDVGAVDGFLTNNDCSVFGSPYISHGECVSEIVDQSDPAGTLEPAVSAARFNLLRSNGEIADNDLRFQLNRIASGAASQGHTKVVNLSIEGAPGDLADRHGCATTFTTDCQWALANQARSMTNIYKFIERLDSSVRSHLAIALASGNNGLDITALMSHLRSTYPNAFKNILVVGGLSEYYDQIQADQQLPAPPDSRFDSAVDPADGVYIVYAAGGFGSSIGTSFAAPQGALQMARLLKINAGWTGDQLVQMVKAGSMSVSNPASSIPSLSSYRLLASVEEALFPAPVTYVAQFSATSTGSQPGCSETDTISGTISVTLQGAPYLPTPANPPGSYPMTGSTSFSGTVTFSFTPPTCETGDGASVANTYPIGGWTQDFSTGASATTPTGDNWNITLPLSGNSLSPDLTTLTTNSTASSNGFLAGFKNIVQKIILVKQ